MSLFREIHLRAGLGFVTTMLRQRQYRGAADFLLRVMICDSLRALLPTWVNRNWWIVLIGLAFLLAEVGLVLRITSLEELVALAAYGDPAERLSLGRLVTAALTFLLALFGTCLAIFEIRRALARPRLQLSFEGLSPRLATVFVPKQTGSPDQPWKGPVIDLRVWNLSDVTAHHFTVRLAFQDPRPFIVDVLEAQGMFGRVWQRRRDLPGTQWEFRSEEPFKMYGQDVCVIGRIRLRLLPDIARVLHARPPASYTVWIHALIRDEWAGRRQTLQLTLKPVPSADDARSEQGSLVPVQ